MKERCRQICGDDVEHCFINNKKQIACIADIVINKVFGITSFIELVKQEKQNDKVNEYFNEILKKMQELIDWVKFLQIAHDLKTLISFPDETKIPEKRKEMRFPFPEIYQKYIVLKINISGLFVPVTLINFSQHGLQFKCHEPLDINSVRDCTFLTKHIIEKEVSFKVRVKHCEKHNEEFIIGGLIEEVSDGVSFNFFKSVHDYILEILLKQE